MNLNGKSGMINSFKSAYKGKKVLVTGHTGFKGSWLSIWLNELGADVVGYALPPSTETNIFSLSKLENKITSIFGDIRDHSKLEKVIAEYKPEIIFHLAAQPLVRLSYKDPKYTYETNVLGLVNLFEVVRNSNSVKSVINVTSDKCYENKEWLWGYRETEPLGGYDPYSASKACSEIITSSYRNSFFKDSNILLASARAGNVIGGGDWSEDRIIPDCVKAITNNITITVRNPFAIRPWQHVLEPLSGYLWLGVKLINNDSNFADAWNFGPRQIEMVTVGEIVKTFVEKWKGNYEFLSENSGLHEATFLQLDCTKAFHNLKWNSVLSVHEALDWTIDWYRKIYEDKSDVYELSRFQIEQYIKIASEQNLQWTKSFQENEVNT